MARLIIYEDLMEDEETIFETFDLTSNRMLIGSSLDNELVLEAPEIDPAHASLEFRNNHWILQDLGGPGGTYVNGKSLAGPYHLKHGDLIEMGSVKLKFQEREFEVEEEAQLVTDEELPDASQFIKGRVWFATLTGGTLAIIFVIVLTLIIADYFNLIKIADLLPFIFTQ